MRGFRALTVGLALMLQACSSGQSSMPGVLAYQNDGTFRKTSVPGVFSAQPDGSVLHIQSGFVCPATFPNARLYTLQSFPSDAGVGTDVGCDYAQFDFPGGRAKFTIFLVKASQGTTLEQEFDKYLSEMQGAQQSQWAAVNVFGLHGEMASRNPPASFEYDEITLNGHKYRDELIVGIVNGWVIELRSTYPADFSLEDPAATKGSQASLFIWMTTVGAFADNHRR